MNPFPLVLSAPSGGGKTTVTKLLMQRRTDLGYSVSCTTRAPRPGERDGVDYHFLTEAEFIAQRDRGELAEWAIVHGKYYGTLKSAIRTVLRSGKHLMMDIDVQGAAQMAAAWPGAVLVFMLPPSVEVLLARLQERNTEDGHTLLARLKSAHAELQVVSRYHYVLVNDDLEATVARVSSIIDAEDVKRERIEALDSQLSGLIARLDSEIIRHSPN
ncbi:MAG TPA: guanylate kinase [Gemmatimonadaceae bacterium]|nr:guanylate kinase [Gemmatimonadaceae bacterium]